MALHARTASLFIFGRGIVKVNMNAFGSRSCRGSLLRAVVRIDKDPFSNLVNLRIKQKSNRNTLYILDGTALIYSAYYKLVSKYAVLKWDPSLSLELKCMKVLGATEAILHNKIKTLKIQNIATAFDSGKHTFRNDLFADYKIQRAEVSSAVQTSPHSVLLHV